MKERSSFSVPLYTTQKFSDSLLLCVCAESEVTESRFRKDQQTKQNSEMMRNGSRLMRDVCGVFLQQNTVRTACLLCSAHASFGSLAVQENRPFFSYTAGRMDKWMEVGKIDLKI